MTQTELVHALLKFTPAQAAAVHDLGRTLRAGMSPVPEQITDAVFTLEQFAEAYPEYAPVYLGLVRAVEEHCISSGVAANPNAGRFCDEVEANPGVVSMAAFRGRRSDPEAENARVLESAEGVPMVVAFPKEDGVYTFSSCDHSPLPGEVDRALDRDEKDAGQGKQVPDVGAAYDDELLNQILLEAQGVPPPWALYPETFNIVDARTEESEAASIIDLTERLPEQIRKVANPADIVQLGKRYAKTERGRLYKEAPRVLSPDDFGIDHTNLLGANPKLSKGGKECYLSAGLFLAPWVFAGVGNLCPYASKGCSVACLNTAGQGKMGSVNWARVRRTLLLFHRNLASGAHDRRPFAQTLEKAVAWWEKAATKPAGKWPATIKKQTFSFDKKSGEYLGVEEVEAACPVHKLCVRMNNFSDLPWEAMRLQWNDGSRETVMEHFPHLQFYDYTKNPHRMMRFLDGKMPKNYYLTFSWSEINADFAFKILDRGGNVALPFDTSSKAKMEHKRVLPTMFCGYPVIDADETDLRFMDNEKFAEIRRVSGTGVICGLRLKGDDAIRTVRELKAQERAKGLLPTTLTGGFVQYADDAGVSDMGEELPNKTLDPGYKQALIKLARERSAEQDRKGKHFKGWRGVPRGFRT